MTSSRSLTRRRGGEGREEDPRGWERVGLDAAWKSINRAGRERYGRGRAVVGKRGGLTGRPQEGDEELRVQPTGRRGTNQGNGASGSSGAQPCWRFKLCPDRDKTF